LIDAHGNRVNSSNARPIHGLDAADQAYFQALQSNPQLTRFLSEPVRNATNEAWTLYLARKFVAPNGDFLGIVLVAGDLGYFPNFFGTVDLGEDSAITLFRRDGVMLVRHPERDTPGRSYAGTPLFEKFLSQANRGALQLVSSYDGKERLVAGHTIV